MEYITLVVAQTLSGLLNQRATCASLSEAYGYYDDENQIWRNISWQQPRKSSGKNSSSIPKRAKFKCTTENSLLTPTLKSKRAKLIQ